MIKRSMLVLFLFAAAVLFAAVPVLAENSMCREDLDCDPFSPPTNDWTCSGQCEADKCEGAADADYAFNFPYNQCWSQYSTCWQGPTEEWLCQVELENCIADVWASESPECEQVRSDYFDCLARC